MSQSDQDLKEIMQLQRQETRLRSALRDQVGDPVALSTDLRTTQAKLTKLKRRMLKTHTAST